MVRMHSSSTSEGARLGDDVEAGRPKKKRTEVWEPNGSLSRRQIFYVFGLHGVGAMVISGAINFVIGYGKTSTILLLV